MPEYVLWAAIAGAALAGLVIGLLIGQLNGQRRALPLREQAAKLAAELEAERRANQQTAQALGQAREQLAASFSALSSQALRQNSEEFLRLAKENLQQYQIQAQGQLAQREKAVESLVAPIKETLARTEAQLRTIEGQHRQSHAALNQQLRDMLETQQRLQGETRNLAQALRRPEVRGQWGEMTLKRLAELAGMVEYCDFQLQASVRDSEGATSRPDMVVRMPDGREIVVDVKTPLDAYLSAVEAPDEAARTRELERHARQMRERVRELASKAYWTQFKRAPDFVVLFVPGDQFLSAALDVAPDLLEEALRQKVILATPTSFVALLRAVAFGWRQEQLAENAEKIRELGEEMYGRLATFTEHLHKVGRSLEASVTAYNRAVGSFDSRILPGARRFNELGIAEKKPLADLDPVDKSARAVAGIGSGES
ncbi:DNA recombination protein RmuC [Ectothiorhodospiraceae bacterium 2226]|nr:DNA recombination protein RmuC [Ectothiorhodospiraceae bacterium 2226]